MKKNPIDKISYFLLFIIIILFIFSAINYFLYNTNSNKKVYLNEISITDNTNNHSNLCSEEISMIPLEKANTTITLTAIGDIMCHNTQFKDAFSNGVYDFSYVFSDIKDYIQNADIAIGNLETTFAGASKGYGGYPEFNTPEALAYNLKNFGLDVISTANNHSLDTGYSGLESTINFLNDANLSHTGTFTSTEEQNTILYKDVNGIKIAFLSFTYGTNGNSIPKRKRILYKFNKQ